MKDGTIMEGVREYSEEMEVRLEATEGMYKYGVPDEEREGHGRLVIRAWNEGGYNSTQVDLLELLQWLRENRPDLLDQASAS